MATVIDQDILAINDGIGVTEIKTQYFITGHRQIRGKSTCALSMYTSGEVKH